MTITAIVVDLNAIIIEKEAIDKTLRRQIFIGIGNINENETPKYSKIL